MSKVVVSFKVNLRNSTTEKRGGEIFLCEPRYLLISILDFTCPPLIVFGLFNPKTRQSICMFGPDIQAFVVLSMHWFETRQHFQILLEKYGKNKWYYGEGLLNIAVNLIMKARLSANLFL